MLIDCSYFTKGARLIRNATLGTAVGAIPNVNSTEVNAVIEAFIADNQELFLTRMLGDKYGRRINAYLICLEEDEQPKNNEAFDSICYRLRESYADYVFYRILRENNTQATITGLVLLKSDNDYVSPIHRQVSTWNRMVDRNRIFARWAVSEDCPVSGLSVSSDMLTTINSLNL